MHPLGRKSWEGTLRSRWRELRPAFARVTHMWTPGRPGVRDETRTEGLVRAARWMQETGTEIYLTTWNPLKTEDHGERDAYAQAVAAELEYLIREQGLSNIRYYCMTNELSLGSWASLREDLPTFRDYHRRIHAALRARDLDVGLLATDASPIKYWDTLEWAAENMDAITAVYGGHHYVNDHELDDPEFYPWFLGECRRGAGIAAEKGKRFIIGEFGARQNREPVDGKKMDACVYWDTRQEPMVGIQLAEAILAAVNAGVYAIAYWTFTDFPDDWSPKGYNKWGLFEWDYCGNLVRAPYYAVGLLTRYFRGPATRLEVRSDDPLVRAAAVRQDGSGTWSIAVLNRHAEPCRVNLVFADAGPEGTLRRYHYDPSYVRSTEHGNLQDPVGWGPIAPGGLEDELPATSLGVYTSSDWRDGLASREEEFSGVRDVGYDHQWLQYSGEAKFSGRAISVSVNERCGRDGVEAAVAAGLERVSRLGDDLLAEIHSALRPYAANWYGPEAGEAFTPEFCAGQIGLSSASVEGGDEIILLYETSDLFRRRTLRIEISAWDTVQRAALL
jgi:hypothetical protein